MIEESIQEMARLQLMWESSIGNQQKEHIGTPK